MLSVQTCLSSLVVSYGIPSLEVAEDGRYEVIVGDAFVTCVAGVQHLPFTFAEDGDVLVWGIRDMLHYRQSMIPQG